MAATVFEIIGIIAIVVFATLSALLLILLNNILKGLNRRTRTGAGDVINQLGSSMGELETARAEIESLEALTAAAGAAMGSAIGATDRLLALTGSRAFKTGLPVLLSITVFAVLVARGRPAGKRSRFKRLSPRAAGNPP